MSDVKIQYEAYPYPERDPADEARRLITGSPSHPLEIDHFIFGGQRDWSQPLRALVAGGGTGDGLVQLAQLMAQAGKPCEITYIDLSSASREIAQARIKARGLANVRFITGSLLEAPDLGRFDYIDCCGVLHHLPDPAAGFTALRGALAPGGGMGMMVYAPLGRSGVYPLQEAFGALFADLPPHERLQKARALLQTLPEGHPFKTNPNLGDHTESDAGFYDLLLHSQDRAYDVTGLLNVLDETGWALSGFTMPALYDLSRITTPPDDMPPAMQMALAEKLRGTIKTHVAYVVDSDSGQGMARGSNKALIPHLKGIQPSQLAQAIARGQRPRLSFAGVDTYLTLPRETAPLIAAIDGRRSLSQIAGAAGMDPIGMGALWAQIERELVGWGVLLYSTLLR
jgi:SAM-dependent methyltransferase